MLSFFDENDQIKLPSGGTIHHFVKYRLGEEGIKEYLNLWKRVYINYKEKIRTMSSLSDDGVGSRKGKH